MDGPPTKMLRPLRGRFTTTGQRISPSQLQQMTQKLQDELRRTTDSPTSFGGYMSAGGTTTEAEIARKKAESRLFGLPASQSERIRQEMARYATMRDPRLRYKVCRVYGLRIIRL